MFDTGKIHLIIAINFISTKDDGELRYHKS